MKILVTGANGQLGSEIRQLASKRSKDVFTFVDLAELDITDAVAVHRMFTELQFDVCINCAAYTAVDKAEEQAELARKVNVQGAENLAVACDEIGAALVHISTDFVFDGNSSVPYTTEHPVQPLGIYGLTKAEGEFRVLSCNEKTWLIRTSWVYSAFGANFVKTMIRLGKEKASLGVVDDQVGAPTWAHDLAEAILLIIDKGDQVPFGIYHYSNEGAITWCTFAAAIMQHYGLDCVVNPIGTADYPTPAKRPAYSVLDTSLTKSLPGLQLVEWEESLIKCITEIKLLENAGKN